MTDRATDGPGRAIHEQVSDTARPGPGPNPPGSATHPTSASPPRTGSPGPKGGAARLLGLPAVLLLVLLVGGCGDWLFGPGESGPPAEITELPRTLSPVEEAVIEGSTRFGLELLRAVAAEEGTGANVVLSPLSASMALGMTLEGAEGETFRQMRDVLGFEGLERAEVSAAHRDLLDLLYGLDPGVDFRIANSVWHRDEFEPESPFLEAVRGHFDAVVEGLDFSSDAAVDVMNDWVKAATGGRIEEIVEPPIHPLTEMFLINALYFNGDWTWQFDPDRTTSAPFTLRDGSQVEVPMMRRDETPTRVAVEEGFTAVELPYGGRAYVMTIVLPPYGEDHHDFAASLDLERWNEITGALADRQERETVVYLPRFQLEYEKVLGHWEDPGHQALQALGMTDAFVPGLADLTRMHRDARDMGLHVHEVKQKTWLDVHERGTEAAAVTSVETRSVSGPSTIRVDRPFFFALRERLSGTLLFVGLVEDPS